MELSENLVHLLYKKSSQKIQNGTFRKPGAVLENFSLNRKWNFQKSFSKLVHFSENSSEMELSEKFEKSETAKFHLIILGRVATVLARFSNKLKVFLSLFMRTRCNQILEGCSSEPRFQRKICQNATPSLQ